jgi:esterase/lipase superfamily enzyme
MKSALATFPAFLLLFSCAGGPKTAGDDGLSWTERISRGLNGHLKETYADTRAVDVYFATNRAQTAEKPACSDAAFGVNPGERVQYGVCRVNVPKRHAVGSFEVAPNPRADPHRYFRMLGHRGFDNEDALREALLAGRPEDVMVFVHGFNVKFEEAVYRASQIAYDVKFQGPVVLFTWPAGAGSGFLDSKLLSRTYSANTASAQASVDTAAQFLKFLSSLNTQVHVLVHSMGHQVMVPALAKASAEIDRKFIGELVLNAPDISIEQFLEQAPRARSLANRVTLYCSYNDNAIAASESYNGGRRMGGCERIEGVDVINVGEIDAPALGVAGLGHGYYASRSILSDVYQVLLRIEAERRLFIRKSEPNATEDYYLRP